MTCLFVGNLTKGIQEDKLYQTFRNFGKCTVELKGQYAFIEYLNHEDANNALKSLNKTNLNKINGAHRVRIEYSHKKKETETGKLQDNEIILDESAYFSSDDDKEEDIKIKEGTKNFKEKTKNICFICKLPGHFAKDCILTKESCYECGGKGHLAKECKQNVREAKELTENRVKAILSQQTNFKFINSASKLKNIIKMLN